MTGLGSFKWLQVGVVVVLLALSASQLVIYSPPIAGIERTLAVNASIVASTSTSTTIDVEVTHASSDKQLRLVAFPLSSAPPQQREVYVYSDSAYPIASVAPTVAQGVFYHLAGELLIRNYSRPVVQLNTSDLLDLLRATGEAKNTAIVMMTGVAPAEAFSRRADLIGPWVMAGGLMIWGGATIGYYSARAGSSLVNSSSISYAEMGPSVLLGKGVATFPWVTQRAGSTASAYATALGIKYSFTSAGIRGGMALALGGRLIGWLTGQFSSVTYLPRGQGGYLLFGGEIQDEATLASDLAQILLSGVIAGAGPVAARDINLAALAPTSRTHWEVPLGSTTHGMIFVAFDPSLDGAFYYSRVLLG